MLGSRFHVGIHDNADGFFPRGDAAVGVVQALAAFVVVVIFLVQLGVAVAFGQNPFAGNTFFVDVERIVFFQSLGGRFAGRTVRFAIATAPTTSPAASSSPPSRFAVVIAISARLALGGSRFTIVVLVLDVCRAGFTMFEIVVKRIVGKIRRASPGSCSVVVVVPSGFARAFAAIAVDRITFASARSVVATSITVSTATAAAATTATTRFPVARSRLARFGPMLGMLAFRAIVEQIVVEVGLVEPFALLGPGFLRASLVRTRFL